MSLRRRHVCLHCRERKKREHRLLFPHVDQSSAVHKNSPHLSPMSTSLTELTAAGFINVTPSAHKYLSYYAYLFCICNMWHE